ncbi:hypothetical protein MPC4_250066 [Methylocella tundrae]|uniref:Uncharacterized protein n=1 Tax=Methylocella tundrae TaxID=227605 RepID=A0A8B6M727_METTU|nr:hypothetical protein MPC4_250066 [Methylocella tundrae]
MKSLSVITFDWSVIEIIVLAVVLIVLVEFIAKRYLDRFPNMKEDVTRYIDHFSVFVAVTAAFFLAIDQDRINRELEKAERFVRQADAVLYELTEASKPTLRALSISFDVTRDDTLFPDFPQMKKFIQDEPFLFFLSGSELNKLSQLNNAPITARTLAVKEVEENFLFQHRNDNYDAKTCNWRAASINFLTDIGEAFKLICSKMMSAHSDNSPTFDVTNNWIPNKDRSARMEIIKCQTTLVIPEKVRLINNCEYEEPGPD